MKRYLIGLIASFICLIILFILAFSLDIAWLKEYSFVKIFLIAVIVNLITNWITGIRLRNN